MVVPDAKLLDFQGLISFSGQNLFHRCAFRGRPCLVQCVRRYSNPLSRNFLTIRVVRTSSITAYNHSDTFHVTAGTGPFNGSFVEPFLESFDNVVPYWALALTYNFVSNLLFSISSRPITCPRRATQCDSYLLPGGTYLMYPQPSPQPSADSTVIIYDAPGTQIDFAQGLDASDQFLSQDCIVYGDENSLVGVEFCLAMSQASKGSVLAGRFPVESRFE